MANPDPNLVVYDDQLKIMEQLGAYLKARRKADDLVYGPDDKFIEMYIVYWQISYINDFLPPLRVQADRNHYYIEWVVDGEPGTEAYKNSQFVFKWARG